MNGKSHLLYVKIDDEEEMREILSSIESAFFYCDLESFNEAERKKQIYDSIDEEFDALCEEKREKARLSEKRLKLHDNLHIILDLSESVFGLALQRHSRLVWKSGLVFVRPWDWEKLKAVAKDRLTESFSSAEEVVQLASVFARLHEESSSDPTQFLDLLTLYPELYRPAAKALRVSEVNFRTGIQCVTQSNELIDRLSADVSVKEPEIQQLASEMEQLNKRLIQERLNLDKASKAFRRKEVAARKKSEETQELASDAHRNLEHALPSLDAAMQAINAIDKSDIMEMRQIKNPPEALQQVMEAVCILLGLKADWASAKIILADPYLQQKLLEIDKDNIPEATSKRIRRYIDNPKFIPDEVAKVSKAGCSMCMWVSFQWVPNNNCMC